MNGSWNHIGRKKLNYFLFRNVDSKYKFDISLNSTWKIFIFKPNKIFMSQLKALEALLVQFRDERDWKQFHNPKDLAVALSIEAGELLEAFLWKGAEEAKIEKVKEELADVLAYAILLGHHYDLDLEQVVREKVQKNGEKYSVEKAKGSATKYNEL